VRLWVAFLAAASGYLAGSIPFALVVVRLFGRGQSLRPIELAVPDADAFLRSEAVGATAVRLQLGARYGCLTSLLDMAKAAAVTLAFRLAFPEATYHLIAAGCAVAGHVWPLFHRFRGGRGQSPAIGGLFVIDWPTPLIAYPAALLLGLVTRSRTYVGRFAPMLVAAAWLYVRFADLPHVFFAVGVFAVRVIAMRRELRQFRELRRNGHIRSFSDEAELLQLRGTLTRAAFRLKALARFVTRRS